MIKLLNKLKEPIGRIFFKKMRSKIIIEQPSNTLNIFNLKLLQLSNENSYILICIKVKKC